MESDQHIAIVCPTCGGFEMASTRSCMERLDTSGRGKQQLARIATDAMAHADTRNSYRINADRRVLGRS